MAETASSVNINDIPEELKGYRKALLNAAFGQVFTPEYLRMQIPTAEFPGASVPTQPNQPPPPEQALHPDMQQNNYLSQIAGMGGLGDSAGSVEEMLSHRVQYAGGGLASAAEIIERMLAGDVNLGASGTPLGAYTPPMVVSPPVNIPYNIPTGTQQPPAPLPPTVTPPATAGPNGVITTPTTGSLPVGNPNPTPPPQIGGGLQGPSTNIPRPTHNPNGFNYAPAMFSATKPANFAGADQAARAGYNPAQYADDSVAQDLARQMGGNVAYTNTVGAIAPPSQAMIDAGGSNMHNAGLIADINRRFADDEGMRKFALENLRQEIRSYGGDTGGFAQGGIVKMAEGGTVNPFAATSPTTTTPPQQQSMWSGQRMTSTQPASAGTQTAQAPADKQPGYDYWNTPEWQAKNYYDNSNDSGYAQSQISPTSALGMGTTSTQTTAPPGMSAGAFNPYQAYGGQRILGMGNQGQVDQNGFLQASDLTRNALAGYGNIPSYFSNGEIDAGRNAQGQATTPLGIANDTFDTAGNLAINASQNAQDLSWRSPLQSTFGTALGKIAENPSMFQAGDISLGQLTAPQLDQPIGVGTSQLTSYQMAGPRMVDMSGANINPSYMNGPGDVDANSIFSRFGSTQMGPANQVSGGQIGVGQFTDPGVRDAYMSPFMQSVVDVQRDRANQDFRESQASRSAAAIKAGAFGGNRQAVADSLAERDKQQLLNQIQATGSQAAFENAQQQYERDRGASVDGQKFNVNSRMQGDLANQQAGLQVGIANQNAGIAGNQLMGNLGLQSLLANQGMRYNTQAANQGAYMDAASRNQSAGLQAQLANQGAIQSANQVNLGAALGVQELGANQYMQSQLANQNAGLTAGQANQNAALTTQALARNSGLTAAQANQQTRLSQNTTLLDAIAKADQLQQQAAQGNFSNQLNAMGQQTNSALAANSIGQNRADLGRLAQAQELLRLQSMGQAGAGIDTRTQGALDLGYQDWTNQMNYPYQQMNYLQALLAGTPMGYNQEGVQFQKTNPLSQIAGLGTAALGAYRTSQGG